MSAQTRGSMQQMDLFEETLSKKIQRMERWVGRIQKEIWFLKEVYNMTQRQDIVRTKAVDQQDMFVG